MSDDWSRMVKPPRSRLGRDSSGRPRRDSDFDVSDWAPNGLPILEERYPRRRRGSISDWIPPPRYPPVPFEGRRPHRRSSDAIDDYPRPRPHRRRSSTIDYYPHYHHPQPIVLPPLPIRHRRKSTKKNLYFVRPHDGHPDHRRGALGRFKDAFTGEGPDVFVTSSSQERLMRDRPRRWQWSGYGLDGEEIQTKIVEPGFAWSELEPVREAPWASRGSGEGYDFRTRKYGGLGEDVWTDARWSPGASRGSWPEECRDGEFRRWRRVL